MNFQNFDNMMAVQGQVYKKKPSRATIRFTSDGQGYFIKKHFGVGWREIFKNVLLLRLPVFSASTERLAINKLHALGIPTAQLVAYGQRGFNPIKRQSFLITQALPNVITLEQVSLNHPEWFKDFVFKKDCIQKIAEIARTLHTAGLNHRDFYLCHFLLDEACHSSHPRECEDPGSQSKSIDSRVRGNDGKSSGNDGQFKIYLMDLHRMQVRKRLPMRWRIKDLAALYFSVQNVNLTKRDILRFLSSYFASSWQEVISKHAKFLYKVERRASKLYNKDLFFKQQNWRKRFICYQEYFSPTMKQLLTNPDDLIAHGEILKDEGVTTVACVKLNNQEFIVKRYNIKGFWHRLKRLVRSSRAAICWHNAHLLQFHKIATPKPVAFIEQRFGPLRGKAYFITEYVVGHTAYKCLQKSVAQKIVNILLALSQKNIKHGDMKMGNFVVTDNEVYVTDLDSMRQYHPFRYKWNNSFAKDKERMLRCWQDDPDAVAVILANARIQILDARSSRV